MAVDHAGKAIMTIGTGDATVIVGILTILMISDDIGGIIANGDLTGIVTGDNAIATRAELGIAAAARRSHS